MVPVGHLLCDVVSGQLVEFGVDQEPLSCASKGVQVDFAARRPEAQQEQVAGRGALASSILQLAVGLLGLEVHEKPNSWAEVWRSYEAPKEGDWQQQVLLHLQKEAPKELREQLELSEHALKRITGAVQLLQDPLGQQKPLLLQGYTDQMTAEVCGDLRQWLEQPL